MKKNDNQGKRKDQIQFSENMIVFGLLGMLIVIGIVYTISLFN